MSLYNLWYNFEEVTNVLTVLFWGHFNFLEFVDTLDEFLLLKRFNFALKESLHFIPSMGLRSGDSGGVDPPLYPMLVEKFTCCFA